MEARQERFDRDWNHIRDTRKARGWDSQASERKDRDFSQWASTPVDPETPAEGITTLSLPALLTPEGKTLMSFSDSSGSFGPSEDGTHYMVLFDNVGGNRVAVNPSIDSPIMYGFIFRISSVPEEYEELLAGAVGRYVVSTVEDYYEDGEWYIFDTPNEAHRDEHTGVLESLGIELEPIGVGAAARGTIEARLEPPETP